MASFESIHRIVSTHNLEGDEEVQEWLQKASRLEHSDSATADKALEAIHSKVSQIAAEKLQQPFPEPQYTVDWWDDQFHLGTTEQGSDVYLSADQLAQHAAVLAQSGWGKTTLFRRFMKQLSDTDIQFTAFDLNGDYRHLANRDDIDLIVIPIEKLRFNPLKPPPGVDFALWKNTVAEIFADSQALLNASENFTDEQLSELYQSYLDIASDALEDLDSKTGEIGGGKRGTYPTLIDLETAIDEQGYHPSDPKKSYQSRVLNRVGGIIRSASKTVDCVHGHDLETLLTEYNVVFELDGLRTTTQNFFMEMMYAWILDYRNAQNHGDEQLRHITIWDECKTIFSKYKEMSSDAGLPEIDDRFDKSRNYGEASIGADQEPLKLTDSFLSNTFVKVLGTSLDSKQFNRAAKSMGLDEDHLQRREARSIDTPYALVKIGTLGPFKVKLPRFDVDEDVTDEMLEELYLDQWNQLLHPDTTPIFGSSKDSKEFSSRPKNKPEYGKETKEGDLDLTDQSKHLLEDVAQNPTRILSERYKEFTSSYQGNKAKKELLEKDLISETKITGGSGTLLDFTDKGHDCLKQNNIELAWEGRGDIEHLYWQRLIQDRLEELGFETDIEYQNRDVYGQRSSSDIAVEVALGANQREIQHLEDALQQGYDNILVAARTPQVENYIKRNSSESDLPLEQIEFCAVTTVNDKLTKLL